QPSTPPPPVPPPSPPSSTTTTTVSTSSPQATTTAPPSTPQTQPQPTSTTPSTTTVYYYTPSGEPSGTDAPPPPPPFWVQYVNKKIEIGWSNLPTDTARVVIFRSGAADGPWNQLLAQNQPIAAYYYIRLVDNTLGGTYYYRLEAKRDETVLASYGPVLLPPLAP
ncbi:MAG: hypothetical protein AAB601_01190, partial [Patescibacteria group bacterium]